MSLRGFDLRQLRRAVSLATAAAILLTAVWSADAEARLIDGYCSPTGDYCTSVVRRSGDTFLGIATFSFTGRYILCVREANGANRECKRFRLRKRGDIYRSFIRFTRHFSPRGSGRYCASWHKFGSRLGPKVCFGFAGS